MPKRSVYERFVRPVLFRLDPETAHRVVMAGLTALSTVLWAADRLGQACEEWADRLERRKARRQR